MTAKPATPLPWVAELHPFKLCPDNMRIRGADPNALAPEGATLGANASRQDAAYIVAACNAHPKLVEDRERLIQALRDLEQWVSLATRGELTSLSEPRTRVRALLAELGEGK